ncbi:MAG: nitroreductase family deazaflavin-dependent oxidoreductase [Acidimicrobiales bacterium]
MSESNEYEPSTWDWVREQVAEYEASGGTRANTLRDTGLPIVVMTMIGHRSGKVRKVPVMRVEHGGEYAIVASKGGTPENPGWYHNLVADGRVTIQDGPEPLPYEVRRVTGDERSLWWERSVAAYPDYADYQAKTDREIPVFVASRITWPRVPRPRRRDRRVARR